MYIYLAMFLGCVKYEQYYIYVRVDTDLPQFIEVHLSTLEEEPKNENTTKSVGII